ncbi:MAG: dihydroorotate dehydrogenase (quinone) [Flavobacteriales bacterium]|nr:dihydroorotate dehydrogenase (quinone) [Flavobacteriales bacterium]
MYKTIIKPFLFSQDPEKVHHKVFNMIKLISSIPGVSSVNRLLFQVKNKQLEREVFGLRFINPVGLAAGFDKDALLFNELGDFGFGFIEIGTLTPKGQPGNPKPRLFRLPEDSALINRMGFNNQGVEAAVERLKNKKTNLIIGGNIGKNTSTESSKTDDDYIHVFETLFDYVDYFVVNVSCPNVGNLTKLQEKEPLMQLMQKISEINKSKQNSKPLLLKIAPDLSNQELDDVIDIIKTLNLDGVVASNTSVNRGGLRTEEERLNEIGWPGGLSGKPLKERSTKVIKYLYNQLGDDYPIIGVGGIHSEEDALEKINAGAKLVQVYTGFIYEGPGLVKRINKALLK